MRLSSILFCLRPFSITSSSVGSPTSHIISAPWVSTRWNLRQKWSTGTFPSVSGRKTFYASSLFRYRTTCEHTVDRFVVISRVLSVLATQPQIVILSGCPTELVPLLERCFIFEKGIENPFRFGAFSLPTFMHQRWGSLFGANTFSLLKFYVTFMGLCEGQPRVSLMPEFVKVCFLLSSNGGPLCTISSTYNIPS